jgi:phage terminase large subunit-like protein
MRTVPGVSPGTVLRKLSRLVSRYLYEDQPRRPQTGQALMP